MYLNILIFVVIIILVYWYGTRNFSYWKKKGVKYDNPVIFVGNNLKKFIQTASWTDIICEKYWKYPEEKIVGYFIANEPCLILRDPELIKKILITDFAYFYSRGLNPHKTVIEPMLRNLFYADGDLWKLLRQRLTPAFTSGKLKAMFPLIVERAEKMQRIAADASGKEVDMRDIFARYATDFIGACGFGIDTDSLNDESSVFRNLGKRIFTITKIDSLRGMAKTVMPEVFKHLHFLTLSIQNDTVSLMKQVMKQRNYKPSGRNDFIDLLLELREKGKIVGESIEKRNPDGTPLEAELELDDMLMAAQVFVFFAAGFETSSSAASYTLHQLAFNPEAQKKCQAEIDTVLRRYNDKLCYEAIKEMKYLGMALKEGMRMFPSGGFLTRKCAKKYTIPGTDVTIDEGVTMFVPVQAIQNDKKYFDHPEVFMPERFLPENFKDIQKLVYLPFGDGPRACIGERLGLMQTLAGLAAILHKFSVTPSKNTPRNPITDPASSLVQSILGGIPLTLVLRKKDL